MVRSFNKFLQLLLWHWKLWKIENCLQQADRQQKVSSSPKYSKFVNYSEDGEGSQSKKNMIASKIAIFDKNSDFLLDHYKF